MTTMIEPRVVPSEADRHSLLGVQIDTLSIPNLSMIIGDAVERRERVVIANHNFHSIYLYHRDDAMRAEFLPAAPAGVLGVVTGVRQRGLRRKQRRSLPHCRCEVAFVLRTASSGHRLKDEMRVGIDACSGLRSNSPASELALDDATEDSVAEADGTYLETFGVHRCNCRGRDHARLCGASENACCEPGERALVIGFQEEPLLGVAEGRVLQDLLQPIARRTAPCSASSITRPR